MNDKPGGTPTPFNGTPATGPNPMPNSNPFANSPSNFGARAATGSTIKTTAASPNFVPDPRPAGTGSSGTNSAGATGAVAGATGAVGGAPNPNTSNTTGAINNTNNMSTPGGNATAGAANPIAPGTNNAAMPNSAANAGITNTGATNAGATNTGGAAGMSPLDRPMRQAPPAMPVPEKPKKTGLIIGIAATVGGLLLVIILVVVLVINLNKTDPVTGAINKILAGNAPANLALKGDISIQSNESDDPTSNINIALDASGIPSSLINEANASITFGGDAMADYSIDINEIYAGSNQLYIRIDGLTSTLEGLSEAAAMEQTETYTSGEDESTDAESTEEEYAEDEEVATSEDGEIAEGETEYIDLESVIPADSLFAPFVSLVQWLEGTWLEVDLDQTDESEIDPNGVVVGSDLTCDIGLINTLRSNSSQVAQYYKDNPFIKGSNEKVSLASKNFPVYKIIIDNEKFNNFVNAAQGSHLFDSYLECTGQQASDLYKIPSTMPTIYTEVNNDLNFTRFYWTSNMDGSTMTVDLGLSYPANVNVSEPLEYANLNNALQEYFDGAMIEEGYTEEEGIVDN